MGFLVSTPNRFWVVVTLLDVWAKPPPKLGRLLFWKFWEWFTKAELFPATLILFRFTFCLMMLILGGDILLFDSSFCLGEFLRFSFSSFLICPIYLSLLCPLRSLKRLSAREPRPEFRLLWSWLTRRLLMFEELAPIYFKFWSDDLM